MQHLTSKRALIPLQRNRTYYTYRYTHLYIYIYIDLYINICVSIYKYTYNYQANAMQILRDQLPSTITDTSIRLTIKTIKSPIQVSGLNQRHDLKVDTHTSINKPSEASHRSRESCIPLQRKRKYYTYVYTHVYI